ncbi:hypothetical protein LZC95_08230 [Pendulispora brunnea]|uniref:Uncharacterized protein n=1 Tax=Pendulispora brunnea TaxID=2905690 RepID=A0ABZ2KDP9_9BACT
MKVRAAKAEGHSFESLCRQLAEARRATIARFAAATDDVEPLASEELSSTKVLMFRARLANGPFAATQLAFVGLGAPTGRAGRATTRERAFLSCTFFDHTGVELDPFVRDVLPRLKWRL